MRDYTPWVKRLPSEYFRDHIRVGTQPMEQPGSREDLHWFLEQARADETLVYASDFPHWDWDSPTSVAPDFPAEMRANIFGGNGAGGVSAVAAVAMGLADQEELQSIESVPAVARRVA